MYDNISASQAISLSKTMMFSHGQNALNFQLSFIGWYLLCFFILPIMYVIPYVNQSCAEYAHAVIDMENKKMAEAYARHEEMMRAAYPVIDSPIPEPTVTESPAAEIEEAPPIIENDFTATDGSEE